MSILIMKNEFLAPIAPSVLYGVDEPNSLIGMNGDLYAKLIGNKKIIKDPIQKDTLTYTGYTQTPIWEYYDINKMKISGTFFAINAGTYTATFTPLNGYCWADGTISEKNITWSISKAKLTIPSQNGTLTYNGNSLSPNWNNYNTSKMTLDGVISGIEANTYTATFTLLDQNNYCWSDETNDTKNVTWSISKAKLTIPYQNGTLTYNEGSLSPNWYYYDTSKMTLGGVTSGINAGTYAATFTLLDQDNYCWSDGSIVVKNVNWSIAKAAAGGSLSNTSITLTNEEPNGAITVVGATGSLSASTNDSEIATVTIREGTNTLDINAVGTGTATITINIAASANYNAGTRTFNAIVQMPATGIYGVSWGGSSATTWTRIKDSAFFDNPTPAISNGNGSSPFDNCMPWSGMLVSEREGGTMVSIPKFWYKISQFNTGLKILISDHEEEGFSVSPAHMDRGDGAGERDIVYIGRYHSVAETYKSTTGQVPYASIDRPTARTNLHSVGDNYWMTDFAMRFTIWLLYLVEYANWNSQSIIGYGAGNNSGTQAMGYTDTMQYHTGSSLSSRTTYGLGTQYRNIEGLWDNVFDFLDGCYYNSNGLNIILNPSDFSNLANGILVGKPTNGWPTRFTVKESSGMFPMFIPSSTGGSYYTYSCDYWYYNASSPCIYAGGNYQQSTSHGLFGIYYNTDTFTSPYLGCRLMELPMETAEENSEGEN